MSLCSWVMNSQVFLTLHPLGEVARLEGPELGKHPLHLWNEALIKCFPCSVGLRYGKYFAYVSDWFFFPFP